MRTFAHPDHREMAPADINHAIDTTLTIARNEYKYVADVETRFGELPPVRCYLGDVNQAILNVVVNAGHAIADVVHGSDRRGTITVRTSVEGDHVVIAIGDTGGGIPLAIRERIFDPFFTTKEVGKGTGQGLAITRSVIVTRHGGTLAFESELGKGTTFFLRLPIAGLPVVETDAAA
jgi:signal transduction histidine kinase